MQRKTIEWKRLEVSSRKLEIPGNISYKDEQNKGQKQQEPKRSRSLLKILMTWIDGVITQLESDILECKVKWALGHITTNKASRGDGIPAEVFQILKDDAVKVLYSICQQIWKTVVATGLEKVSVHSNPKEEQCQRMFKLSYN